MEEDEDIFQMFMEIMVQVKEKEPSGAANAESENKTEREVTSNGRKTGTKNTAG